MKAKQIVPILIVFLLTHCKSTKTIDDFAKKIAENSYGVFWQGFMKYQQDTLFFQFVGDVNYRVPEEENQDILYFKPRGRDPMVISREIKDPLNRPMVKESKGKEMTQWSFIGDPALSKRLEAVIKNGDIQYFYLSHDKNKDVETMKKLYGLNNQESQKILDKMYDP
jgi:hypothetical protein